jgi:hypothetical protein
MLSAGHDRGGKLFIRQLTGWPPSSFQATEARGKYVPPSVSKLLLRAASLVPSVGPRDAPEVFLLLMDPVTEFACSTRFKVWDAGIAVRMARALATCKDMELGELGGIEIREESRTFPGLKSLLK